MYENASLEYERVINYIYSLMKDGELGVGSRLPSERVISERLGIGRNATREALSVLQGMGMIESVHGSGNYVSKNAGHSIMRTIKMMLALGSISEKDICAFRREMEKAVCSALLRNGLSPARRQELEYMLHKMTHVHGMQLAAADRTFHELLVAATENELWVIIMEAISELYSGIIREVIRNSNEAQRLILRGCHEELLRGIVSKDRELALSAADRHYDLIEELLQVAE